MTSLPGEVAMTTGEAIVWWVTGDARPHVGGQDGSLGARTHLQNRLIGPQLLHGQTIGIMTLAQARKRLYSELVIDGKTQLSERDKQRFTVM